MSFPRRSSWLPALVSGITLVGVIAIAVSLVSLSPASLTLDAFVALTAAHTLGLAALGAIAVASGTSALRKLRAAQAAEGWSISDSLETHRAV